MSPTRNRIVPFPRYGGYSTSGVFEAVGPAVTDVKVGDRVAAFWTRHSRYCVVGQNSVCKLDDRVSLESGSLCHIATFPLAAIRKCKVEMGESAIVMGLGPLGLIAVQLLRAAGACPIIAVDPIKEKRDFAISLGADIALIRMEACGRIRLSDVISETHSPTDAPEVYTRLITEKGFPVVQFDWRIFK